MLAVVRIGRAWLPLPLVLLWPLLVVAWLLVAMIAAVFAARHGRPVASTLWALWCVLGSLRGTLVDIRPARPTRRRPAGNGAQADSTPPRRVSVWLV